MSTSTTGTGTITLGSAEDGYQSFADAGVANADVVRYVIEDGNNFEIGTGTYTSSGTTLTRTVSESSNSDAAINLSGSATVFIGATAEDIQNFVASTGTATAPNDNVSIAIGGQAVASGTNSISLQRANSSGLDSIAAAIGNTTSSYGAHGSNSISIGALSKATTLAGTAVGYGANSTHTASSAFGTSATTTANSQVALGGSGYTVRISGAYTLPSSDGSANQVLTTDGSGAVTFADAGGGDPDLYRDNASSATTPSATGSNAVAVGNNSVASGTDSLALGAYANATGFRGIAVGRNVYATSTGSNAFGVNAYSAEQDTIALGNSRAFGGAHAFASAIGNNTTTYGAGQAYALALGFVAKAHNANSIAIGRSATVTHDDSVALGRNAASSAANQITLGSSSDSVRISSAYTLPTADGTNGQVLTTDGSGAVTFADAGGGGSPDLFSENYTSGTKPATTGTNAVAIGKGSSAAGTEAIAMVDGTADSQDSFAVGGIVQSAIGGYAIGKSAQVYSQYGLALGKSSLVTAATDGTAVGVSSVAGANSAVAFAKSRASGADSLAGAIANNSTSYGASGANSIAIGKNAKATAQEAVCISNTSTASGSNAAVLGGSSGTASGSGSVALGGSSNVADGVYSTAKGYYGNANGVRLKHATGVYPNQQGAYYVLGYTTSDATPIALNTSVWTPSSTNQIVLPNNSAFAFHGTIVARQQAADGTACAAWKVEGLIRREGSAGTTVLVNSATTVLDNTPNWGMALSADTTNGCLKIQATGAASTDIRWVASVTTSEVTYA